VNQVKDAWKANTKRLCMRRDRVRELLRQFKSFTLTHTSREQIKHVLHR
jgi:hypothetical protein